MPFLPEELVVSDVNSDTTSFLFVSPKFGSNVLNKIEHDSPDFRVVLQVLQSGNPVSDAFDGADIIAPHHGGTIKTICIAFERHSIFPEVALEQIIRRGRELADSVDSEACQNLFRRPSDAEHI